MYLIINWVLVYLGVRIIVKYFEKKNIKNMNYNIKKNVKIQ